MNTPYPASQPPGGVSVSESATAFSFTCAGGAGHVGTVITLPAADHPGPAQPRKAAQPCGADLRQRAVAYHQVIIAAERRVRHHRDIMPRTPWQKITFNACGY